MKQLSVKTAAIRKLATAVRIARRLARTLAFEKRDAPHRPTWYGVYPTRTRVKSRAPGFLEKLGLR